MPVDRFAWFGDAGNAWRHGSQALVQRLRELGWIEGRNRHDRISLGGGTRCALRRDRERVRPAEGRCYCLDWSRALPAKQATSAIPIVFAIAADPVGSGLVASLAQPGGNVTGLSIQQTDVAGKRLEMLREILPDLRRLGIMANVGGSTAAIEVGEAEAAARGFGLETVALEIRRVEDIAPAFDALKGRLDALYVVGDPLVVTNRMRINILALAARLPTMYIAKEHVETGGLISYGPNIPDLFRRAGDYVDKILRGAKPGDLPVEQPTKFDLVINLTRPRRSALTVPPTLLARADEVIE